MNKNNKKFSTQEQVQALQICGFNVEDNGYDVFIITKWYEGDFRACIEASYLNADEIICLFGQFQRDKAIEGYKEELKERL